MTEPSDDGLDSTVVKQDFTEAVQNQKHSSANLLNLSKDDKDKEQPDTPIQKDEEDKGTVPAKILKFSKMDLDDFINYRKGDPQKAWSDYELYGLRTIHLNEPVRAENVNKLIAQINLLETLDPKAAIKLHINSPGGNVFDGLRLYNRMKTSSCPFHGIGDSRIASMASVLLMACDHRQALPNCRILIHEMSTMHFPAKMGDHEQTFVNNMELQDTLKQIISDNTGLSFDDVERLWSRDTYYEAKDSLALGFVDEIIPETSIRKLKHGSRKVPEHLYPENRGKNYYHQSPKPS